MVVNNSPGGSVLCNFLSLSLSLFLHLSVNIMQTYIRQLYDTQPCLVFSVVKNIGKVRFAASRSLFSSRLCYCNVYFYCLPYDIEVQSESSISVRVYVCVLVPYSLCVLCYLWADSIFTTMLQSHPFSEGPCVRRLGTNLYSKQSTFSIINYKRLTYESAVPCVYKLITNTQIEQTRYCPSLIWLILLRGTTCFPKPCGSVWTRRRCHYFGWGANQLLGCQVCLQFAFHSSVCNSLHNTALSLCKLRVLMQMQYYKREINIIFPVRLEQVLEIRLFRKS